MGFRSLCHQKLGLSFGRTRFAKNALAFVIAVGSVSAPSIAFGQGNNGGFFNQRVVGGVKIDANGVLRNSTELDDQESLNKLREMLVGPQGELNQPTNMRLISLKAIQESVRNSAAQNKPVAEELLFLGGLTRVDRIFVYPEHNDIVIGGPSEPWTVGATGDIVGKQSGKPIVLLDDLLNALKSVNKAQRTGISVSIEPTEEGNARLNKLMSQIRDANQTNWKALEAAMCQAFGPQQIKMEGISSDSHIAHVILAADYKMKLYGMNLAQPPVSGLPSYLEMARNSNSKSLQSRWWMACDYSAIEHSEDKLAWKISGQGIKTLTEQEQIASDGSVKGLGKVDNVAKKWADTFTSKLEELSVKDPVFGQLRNVMDLCVVAAIIESNRLEDVASCDLSYILGDDSQVQVAKLDSPKSLAPQCSLIKAAKGFLVSASGGVMVDSWQVASKAKPSDSLTRPASKDWDSSKVWK